MRYGHQTFHCNYMGLKNSKSLQKAIDRVATDVTDWLNAHADGIEVIKIDFETSEFASHAIVWFRQETTAPPPIPR